jgi:hypothetical protein
MFKLVLIFFFYEHLGWGYIGLSRVFEGAFSFSSYGGIDREERKHRKVLFLFLRHNKLNKVNLDRAFGESRSRMIAHKNQKRITAGTHY